MPKESRRKGRVIKPARPTHKKLYIIAALAIAIIAGFAGWYSYSTAHSITTTQNTSTDSVSSAGLAFVRITTHYGTMEIELFQNDTPKTVANFLQLVSSGFYDGLVWHRIVRDTNPTFDLIQTGDPTSANGNGNPCLWGLHGSSTNVPQEIVPSLHNDVGYLAMAYPPNDPGGASSQFFINLSNNSQQLDGRYTVFGKVISGLNIAQEIGNLPIDQSCSSSTTTLTGPVTDGPPQNPSNAIILGMIIEQ